MGLIKVLIGVCALAVGVVGLFKPLPTFKIKNRTVAIYVVILSFLFIMLGTIWQASWEASQAPNIASLSISDFLVAEIQFYLMCLLIITFVAMVAALIKPSLFKFVFKDKTSRKVAGGSFFALGLPPLEEKKEPPVAPQTQVRQLTKEELEAKYGR